MLHIHMAKYAAGNSQDADASESSFRPTSKETTLISTSTLGPKPFLFIPQQVCLYLCSSIHTHIHIQGSAQDNLSGGLAKM